ncbi:MAG: hypothetical protein M3Y82_10580, partial [Verrucomicrobiota bacterium]|nr:hypothetical protein [Verrucomicrobiota bacterium]
MKILSPEHAGLWFSFQSILAIINLTDFGLSFVIARQVSYSLHAQPGVVPPTTDFIVTRPGWLGVSDIYHVANRLFLKVGLVAMAGLVLLYHVFLPMGKLLSDNSSTVMIAWYLLGTSALLSLQAKPHLALVEGLAKLYLTRFLSGTIQLLGGLGIIVTLLLGGRLVEMSIVIFLISTLQFCAARYMVRRVTGGNLLRPTT